MISKVAQTNSEILHQAFADVQVAVVECCYTMTGKPVAVLYRAYREGDDCVFVPLARLFDGNPCEELDFPDDIEEVLRIAEQEQE